MIIWGWTTREIVHGSGQFHCPQCNGQREYHHMRVATYFTLYFIPMFETQHLGDTLKCLTCQLQFTPNVLSHDPGSPRGKKRRLRNRRKKERESGDDYGL
jgi:zinc-ribbon family